MSEGLQRSLLTPRRWRPTTSEIAVRYVPAAAAGPRSGATGTTRSCRRADAGAGHRRRRRPRRQAAAAMGQVRNLLRGVAYTLGRSGPPRCSRAWTAPCTASRSTWSPPRCLAQSRAGRLPRSATACAPRCAGPTRVIRPGAAQPADARGSWSPPPTRCWGWAADRRTDHTAELMAPPGPASCSTPTASSSAAASRSRSGWTGSPARWTAARPWTPSSSATTCSTSSTTPSTTTWPCSSCTPAPTAEGARA